MRALSLDQMRSFAVLIRSGSFSAAARQLNLTQPAVSRQIHELEKRLGVRLVERTGRQVRATQAGEKLLDHIRRIDVAVDEAVAAVAPYQNDTAGRIVVGTGATACIHLLPPVFEMLRRQYPALQILVRTGNTSEIVRQVEDNTIDIGFVTGPVHSRAVSIGGGIADEQVAVFAKRGLRVPASVTARTLAEMPLMLYEPGGNTRRMIDDWFRRNGVEPRPVMELGSIEAIKGLIAAGLGCGILPRSAMGAGERRFVVRSLSPVLHRKLVIVLRKDKVLSGGLRHMLKALKSAKLS